MSIVELISPLTPDECLARLRDATDDDGLLVSPGYRPVIGRVSGRRLRLRKRVEYGNPLQLHLVGRLESRGEGSVFCGRAQRPWPAILFVATWFAGVVVIGGALTINAVAGLLGVPVGLPPTKGDILPVLAILPLPLMLTFGIRMERHGRRLARDEGRFLVAFLADTIQAVGKGAKIPIDEIA